jgi:hypothetical protein
MGFTEKYTLTQNEALRTKVRMAGITAAILILADPGRANEHPFCRLVIKEPMSNYWLDQLMFSVVTSDQITETSDDAVVQNQVNSVFGNHALAFTQTN